MKIVMILSGGMDSSTLLWHLLNEGHKVKTLSFDYGQRHRKELDHAAIIADRAMVAHEVVDLSALTPFIAQGSQVGSDAVPDGHYAAETMKTTIVPNRNMIMLSVAVGHAITLKFDAVAYGPHGGDHTIYPDCRAEFVEALGRAIFLCDWHKIKLLAPFLCYSKADLVRIGSGLGVPFDMTWSCYKGGELHCGTCGTCVERKEAFVIGGVIDPTRYEQ